MDGFIQQTLPELHSVLGSFLGVENKGMNKIVFAF